MPTRIDTTRTPSLFHMEWLVPVAPTEADDHTRAVAEKADALLRAAAFIAKDATQEVRVWIEAACESACVSVTFEPGAQAYAFHVLDESLRERIACVVFDDLPCIGARDSTDQLDLVLEAIRASGAQPEPTVRVRVKSDSAKRKQN